MSAQVRQAIASAANTVAGVSVTPYYWQVTNPGDGCVRLVRTEYPNRLGGVSTWHVVIALHQDIETAERWLDENGSALREALAKELDVGSLTPAQTTDVPCVVIEGLREED